MASEAAVRLKELIRAAPGAWAPRSVEERRASAEMLWPLATTEPDGTTYEAVDAGGVPAEWARLPSGTDCRPIVYLHGGGYTIGSIATHRKLAAHLAAAAGRHALVLGYRLAPEHPFPAALDDAVAAFRWLLRQDVRATDVVLAGDSAGGGLALATSLRLRDAGDPLPGALVLLSPWTDVTLSGESVVTKRDVDLVLRLDDDEPGGIAYLGGSGASALDPLVSPLYADHTGLPPMYVQVGSDEILLDDSTRLADRARAAGVDVRLEVWQEMFHVFQILAGNLPEADDAVGRIGAWLRDRDHTAHGGASSASRDA